MRNSERLGLASFFFVNLGKGKPALRISMRRLTAGLPSLPEVSLPVLTGEMLADVVRRQGATSGSLDGFEGSSCSLF